MRNDILVISIIKEYNAYLTFIDAETVPSIIIATIK